MIKLAPSAKPADDNLDRDNIKNPSHGAVHIDNATQRLVEEIRACLIEQIKLLGTAHDFENKALVSNCAQVSLMLIRQLSLRVGRL